MAILTIGRMRNRVEKKLLNMKTFLEIDFRILMLAMLPFVPLIIGVIKNPKNNGQSFITWALYCFLDGITMFSSKEEGSHSYSLLLGFLIGSFLMSAILLYQWKIGWGPAETITITLIIICVFVWKTNGSYYALIAGILSESVVGGYLFYQTRKNPIVEYNLISYIGFLIVSIITILIAQDWSLKEVGYPISETVFSFLTILPLVKKWREIRKRYLLIKKFRITERAWNF
jgi:hypothetical protein